jgi:thiol-disulfide isomerase/thioredoxin
MTGLEATVKKLMATLVLAVTVLPGVAGQTSGIIPDVRGAIKANDFAAGDKLLAAYRAGHGVTADYLEALSWMGRGTLAVKNYDAAERYARDTYQLSLDMLKKRPLDQEPRLPIALGAAIEVLAHVDTARGARSEAVLFLQKEVATYKGTSIEKRIRKNINLITLEGQPAPALDLAEYLGPKPPTLASMKGKVVLLFFWAHWCGDCKQQAPILADLVKKYGNQGFTVVAPTMRFGYTARGQDAGPDEEMRYIDQVRNEIYPVLAGQPIPVSEATHLRYGVSTTPTLVLVDRGGLIRMYNPGRMTLEQLEPRIRTLVQAS